LGYGLSFLGETNNCNFETTMDIVKKEVVQLSGGERGTQES